MCNALSEILKDILAAMPLLRLRNVLPHVRRPTFLGILDGSQHRSSWYITHHLYFSNFRFSAASLKLRHLQHHHFHHFKTKRRYQTELVGTLTLNKPHLKR
jgi:hypothetical protein